MNDDRRLRPSERFAKRLSQIGGIKHFVLARNDGVIVSHNHPAPDDLASLTALCGMYALQVKDILEFCRFEYMCMNRSNHEDFLIFPLDRYFLGVVHHSGISQNGLVEKLTRFLQSLLLKKESSRQEPSR